MASSIKDIAKATGVSAASVSIYLNHPDTNRVSKETKKKIDYYAEKLNYRKNILASGLSGKNGKIIGIIIPTVRDLFQNEFTNTLLSGAQNILKEKGFSMLFIPSSSAESETPVVIQQLKASGGCDAYILFSTGFCTLFQVKEHIEALEKTDKPFVTLNIPLLEIPVNQVVIPGLSSLTTLNYLYDRGHRKILILLGRSGGQHVRMYLDSYKSFLAEKGMEFDPDLIVYGNYDEGESRRVIHEFLNTRQDITAICCGSDLMASCALVSIEEAGLNVPEDISLTGLDNTLYSRLAVPRITTVDLKIYEAGQEAGRLLLNQIDRPGDFCKIQMDEILVEGQSVQDISKGGIQV
jgi:DNA-binding LacI/PurR family transcriptional regulator